MTEHFFPAFGGTTIFLDVLSDWFHYLKLFLTQENVNKRHVLGFAMQPHQLLLAQMLAGGAQAGLWFKMDPMERFTPKPCNDAGLSEGPVYDTGTLGRCAPGLGHWNSDIQTDRSGEQSDMETC